MSANSTHRSDDPTAAQQRFLSLGFEPGTIHWLIRNNGVLGLTVFGPGSGNFKILATPPVLTLDQFGMWIHLVVVLDGHAMNSNCSAVL